MLTHLPAFNRCEKYVFMQRNIKPGYMDKKLKFILLLFSFVFVLSCKTRQVSNATRPSAGLFKVAILYPNGDDKTFDMEYYEKKHMPMVAGILGKNLKFYEIDKGLSGRTPGDKAPYVAVGYFYISNVAEYGKAIAQNRDAVVGDFKNYTNIQPVVNISEIKQLIVNSTN
jgi:uncharacterized protein (TIGR02118 family)